MRSLILPPALSIPSPKTDARLPVWKRTIDLGCCLLALPALILLNLVMTVVTALISPGPVIFRQERIGWKGRPFRIYKFRTMHTGADPRRHEQHVRQLIGSKAPMMKLDACGESRLYPGSWLLRATGLDELPQIINVIQGDMTIVGPRPCLPAEFSEFQPWQCQRFEAMPGLTGLWQVSGKNRTTFEEMIRLDIHYAKSTSVWLDVKIILLTVPALLGQVGDIHSGRRSSAPSEQTIPPFE